MVFCSASSVITSYSIHYTKLYEKGAASAYLGAVPQFANRDLAKAAASILGDETMHWAVLLGALGENPVPAAFRNNFV